MLSAAGAVAAIEADYDAAAQHVADTPTPR